MMCPHSGGVKGVDKWRLGFAGVFLRKERVPSTQVFGARSRCLTMRFFLLREVLGLSTNEASTAKTARPGVSKIVDEARSSKIQHL